MTSWVCAGAVVAGTRASGIGARAAIVLGVAALACGAATDSPGPLGNGGTAGAAGEASGLAGAGAGGAAGGGVREGGVGGGSGFGTGGANADQPPATAPACTPDPGPVSGAIELAGEGRTDGAPYTVRVVDRGFGLPPGVTSDPNGAVASERGWLRLAVGYGDAGLARLDSGPADAGSLDDLPQQVVTGPREVGDLPVTRGDELELTYDFDAFVSQSLGRVRVVLAQSERALIFYQSGNLETFGTFSGFTLARGDALCAEAYPTVEQRCADIYRHELDVTVPGGSTATLAPGGERAVGAYRVIHGSSTSVTRIPSYPENSACADLDQGSLQVTAILTTDMP
jgi:hypothetical protein